ncbi:GH92 family glycosyl hydrolase [Aeoliella mucimassa]|uniref:Glycosyl hydrolase family 92 n=1 Tax=Aeoliella mucimassa TaxID=2527972 RepID=A0A518ANJ8_9BACT|nr:GH92 family glycosyl hydrolase [Aeoliella mucimassa]QDU56305.1 Glycosyl hydrolase family 92 [Aeoliella mucimassa]
MIAWRTLVVLFLSTIALPALGREPVEWVDPTIGGVGQLLQPTRPTVQLPNSMVRVYPMRNDVLDDTIESFPLTLISHRLGELFSIMPGDESHAPWDQETTTPYYYSVRFDDSWIVTEFTPAERGGVFRFTFPNEKMLINFSNRHQGYLKTLDDQTVVGEENFDGMKAYLYAKWSQPVAMDVDGGDRKHIKVTAEAKTIELRYAVSFISVDQAESNYKNEVSETAFDTLRDNGKQQWNEVLGRIRVKGGTDAQKRVFYTSLYRCYERMICITEDGKYYSAYDHKVHEDDRPFYVDNWIWDTFRALEPLHTLLSPEMQGNKIQSYVRMYEQSGWMPSFAVLWGDHACMNGNHAAAWIADAWVKGVDNFDLPTAYEGLCKNSLEATLLPWRNGPKCSLDDFYHEHGYFPALRPGEKETEPAVHGWEKRQAVAVTLGNSYDDWCIAQLAEELGKQEDYELFSKRADFYKNLWNADKGFMWPKHADGSWIEPMDPKFDGGMGGRDYYDENNAYTYNWDVLHDFDGLIDLMGGPAATEAKLDQLFREGLGRSKYDFWGKFPDSTGLIGQFVAGNEPSFSTPYVYNRVGAPWKTQKRIRSILESWFTDTIHGVPGDEDGGGMSAWVVFSMMGFYPVTPGLPEYDLGSPIFDEVEILLPNGKTFRIVAHDNSRNNKYIEKATINGTPLDGYQLQHADVAKGGVLELQMSDTPPHASAE